MGIIIQKNVHLAAYTTLKVGGVADYFVIVKSKTDLLEALQFANQIKQSPIILGGGSNVLIADNIKTRLVIKMELKGIEYKPINDSEMLVIVAAGERWDDFVADTVSRNLAGLENLSGIPGTVGAAPIQNINAYGATVGNLIDRVTVLDTSTGEEKVLTKAECLFDYRDSVFKQLAGRNLVVTSVTFLLSFASQTNLDYQSSSQSIERFLKEKNIINPTPKDVREAILVVRSNIGMLEGQFRSAGSFFKNVIVTNDEFVKIKSIIEKDFSELNEKFSPWHWPQEESKEKISTAFLMECSSYNKNTFGIKRFNNVGLSPKHSLSIVTEDGATATDVKNFVEKIILDIKNIFNVTLETEVNYIE